MLPLTGYLHALGRFLRASKHRDPCRLPRGWPDSRPHRDPGGPEPMSGFKRLPFLVLLAALTAPAARAQIAGHPVEASLNGGLIQYDARDRVRGSALGLGTLGYRWSTGLTFEYAWLGSTTKRDAT